MRIQPSAVGGQQVTMTMPPLGVAQHSLTAWTHTTSYVPVLDNGTTTVETSCNCACHGNPVCDANYDILDVVETIGAAFRNVAPTIDASCPHVGRPDVDCSGGIDVIDVGLMVNVVFRNANPQTTICNPCNP
jgi:hypothetical protein